MSKKRNRPIHQCAVEDVMLWATKIKSKAVKKNLIAEKPQIFKRMVDAIHEAVSTDKDITYVANVVINDKTLKINLRKDSWKLVLEKAFDYYMSIDEFELCQFVKDLLVKITEKTNG